MLKDKKKLTTKVDSLTRKVATLQAKLAAAKEVPRDTNPRMVVSPPAQSSSSNYVSPLAASTIFPSPPTYTHDRVGQRSQAISNRVVSGPASLARPKTPERRPAPPAVFKARTPERRAPPVSVPAVVADITPVSSVGKKRARPDDFDAGTVPVQALYAEEPERENTTPRLRRALQSVQAHTGFTPARHSAPRNAQGTSSPARRATLGAAGMSDVTNSPRAMGSQTTKSSKRSWLGKIRGGSSQTSSRTPVSRASVFERVPGS